MAVRELRSTPSMLTLFARAGVALVPGASMLPCVGGAGGSIPDLTLTLNGVEVDRGRLAAYDRVCGFSFSDVLPVTYPHVLAFPLQLALMTDGSFPFPAIGLVHIANEISQRRPIRAGERLALRVWATAVAPHPRGSQFTVRSEASLDGEVVWEESSTNLRRGSGSGQGEGHGSEIPPTNELPTSATWTLPEDLGRRYGSASGDLNPIHVHPLSARLFGFPSAIAHGMWTKARCLAALEPQLPKSLTVAVSFRKPILLPATVEFASQAVGGDAVAFGVRDAAKGTPHLDGLLKLR